MRQPRGHLACLVIAGALGVAGCGSDGSGDSGDGSSGAAQRTETAAEPNIAAIGDPTVVGDDEDLVQETLDDLHQTLIAGLAGYCLELSDPTERQLAKWVGQPGAGCFDTVDAVVKRRRQLGVRTVHSKLVSLRVRRRRNPPMAIAQVRDPGGAPYRARFVWENGEWRVLHFMPETASGLGPS